METNSLNNIFDVLLIGETDSPLQYFSTLDS
jgi:hypothetical protein